MKDLRSMIREEIAKYIRVGQISSSNAGNNGVRVAFDDMSGPTGDKFVSGEMQQVQHNTVNAKNMTLPEVGEHVLCISLPNGDQEGFVIGSFYSASNLPKGNGPGLYQTLYQDGTLIEYDLNTNTARIRTEHTVEVECKDAIVKATNSMKVDVEGDMTLTVAGDLVISSDSVIKMTAPTINLN